MFGLESWDGNVEGLIAALTCLIVVLMVAKESWKTRHDGTWNEVFKMYGLVMAGIFVWIICLIIAPMPTAIISGLLVWWSIATV